MTELRSEIDYRIDGDTRLKIAVTHLVDTEEGAREAGELDQRLTTAYIAGFAEAAE